MIQPNRVFLGWNGPALPRVADWLIEHHPLDLGEQVVVVPGRRSGRLLLAHLVARVERRAGTAASGRVVGQSHPFIPPRIVTPGMLPELLYRAPVPVANRRERVLAWCAILESAPAGSWPGAGASGEVSARVAFARDLVRAQDELGEEGLRLADVPRRAAAALAAAGEAARWSGLGALEREEVALLGRRGLADPTAARLDALARRRDDGATATAADGGERRTGVEVDGPSAVLCCLAALRGLEREFLARFARSVTALIAAPDGDSALFDAWGSVDSEGWRRRQVTVPPASLVVVGRPRDQAQAVGRLVAASLGDGEAQPRDLLPGERLPVTVGLADPSLSGVVGEALADRGLAFHDALGRPLASSAPWRLVQAAGRYAGTRTTRELAALLRHPDLERHLAPAIQTALAGAPGATSRELRDAIENRDWLTALDLYSSETALDPVAGALPGDPAGAALVEAMDGSLRAALGDGEQLRPLAVWTERIRAFLLAVYGDREFGGEEADRELARALSRLGEELRAQANAAAAHGGGPQVRLADAIDLLVAEVAGEPLSAAGSAAAVEVVGWLELPLDDASRLVVAGLDEGAAAAALAGGLLGPALRRSLGVQDAETLHARDLYYLELLSASRDATFVTGRRGAQGEPLAPRRILLAGSTPELVETVLAFWGASGQGDEDAAAEDAVEDAAADDEVTGETGAAGSEADGLAAIAPVGEGVEAPRRSVQGAPRRPRSTRGAFGPILPSPAAPIPDRLPATAFRDYLACPYRFYLRHVLGLRQVRDLPRELEPGEFGRLLHAVVGRFARAVVASSDDAETIARALERLLEEEVALRSGGAPRVAVRLQLEQLRRRLRAFAGWQAAQTRAGWAIVPEHTETRLEATLDVDGVPFVVTGRVDRVDRHATAGGRLIDYKSAEQSVTPEQAHRQGRRDRRRWIDLQLPLYELMLRQRGLAGPLALGFVNLGHRLSPDPLVLAEWSAADLADAIATARDVVRAIRARRFWPPGEPPSYSDGFEGIAGDAFPDRERYWRGGNGFVDADGMSGAGASRP